MSFDEDEGALNAMASIASVIAPVVATVAGGPLAGAAVSGGISALQGGDVEDVATSALITGAIGSIGGGGTEALSAESAEAINSIGAIGDVSAELSAEIVAEGAKTGIKSSVMEALGVGLPGGKFALGKAGLEAVGAGVSGISNRNTAKDNIDIQNRRAENTLRDFDFNSRALEGNNIARAGASGMNINAFDTVFKAQELENSRKRNEQIFENSITLQNLEAEKDASFIKPAFAVGTSLLDFQSGNKRRKSRESEQQSLLQG